MKTNMGGRVGRLLAGVTGCAIAALCFGTPTPAFAETTILFSPFAPPNDVINTGIIFPWAKEVEKVTEGRVKIKFSDTPLAPPPQQWEMVTQGIADAAYQFNGFEINRLYLPQIAHLPFLGPSAEASSLALWQVYEKHFKSAGEYRDVHLIGLLVGPTGQFYSLNDNVLDDVAKFKNLKMWALPGVPARAMAKLGASVVPGPAVRIHDVVSKGIVDAFAGIAVYHADAYNGIQFAKSVTVLPGGISAPSFSVILRKAVWDAIPPADQKLVNSVSGEALAHKASVWDKGDAEAWKRFLGRGGKRVDASPAFTESLAKEWSFFDDEWIANAAKRKVDGKAALADYRAELKRLQAGAAK
jgi:TRAP-type C4-dicarboxylate transport system substrate-binding protein